MLPHDAVLRGVGLDPLRCEGEFFAQTNIAQVWKLRLEDGRIVALKHYQNNHLGNEATGYDWMAGQSPALVAQVYGRSSDAMVFEWLEGPSLGDLSRGGRDAEACDHLAGLAAGLAETRSAIDAPLPCVSTWFEALFEVRIDAACPAGLRADMKAAQALARRLLDSTTERCALHGDLHHDNVILTRDGPRAFDAKGVMADPAYEMANAFRNPKGMGDVMRDAQRIERFADQVCAALTVERPRLLEWVAAKSALSIAWSCKGALRETAQAPMLGAFLKACR